MLRRKSDISIAQEVRQQFESRAVDKGLLLKLCNNYRVVDHIEEFLDQAVECFPYGNELLASLYLRERMGKGTVAKGTFHGNLTYFLLLDNMRIADITADQRGGPGVYIGPLVEPWRIR